MNQTNQEEADLNDDSTPENQATEQEAEGQRNVVDRRLGLDRRKTSAEESGFAGEERRKGSRRTGLERRRGAGIRREEDRRSAEEGEMSPEQFEFVMAIETYKKVNKKLFPTWTEVLEVITQLGYQKVTERQVSLENVPEAPVKKVA